MAEGGVHVPVLAREIVSWLAPALAGGGVLVDCTVGSGGHASALLAEFPAADLVGIDRDAEALEAAQVRLEPFGSRVRLHKANFSLLAELLSRPERPEYREVSAVLYDLGVSSPQLDQPRRGFGFRGDQPLDMRMDRSEALAAEELVNTRPEAELARILSEYGEERFARRIAAAIVRRRARRPFTSGEDLAETVKEAIPAAARRSGPHPARRTFQALRIEVNGELAALSGSLPQAHKALRPGGRLAVISYHSLEDRIVKSFFAEQARGCVCPKSLPVCVCGAKATLAVLTRKPVRPGAEEIAANPRARSAKLRVAERVLPPEAA